MMDKLLFLFAAAGLYCSVLAFIRYHAAAKAEKLQRSFDEIEGYR